MSLLPAHRTRRAVLLVTSALVASLLPTLPLAATAVAAPAAPAAVLLPAPTVTPASVPAGTTATVAGGRCVPKGSTRVYVSLTTGSGGFVSSISTVPTADGTWTVRVTPPISNPPGAYSVSATCDRYGSQAAYRPRTLTVTAPTAAPWTGQSPSLPNVPNGSLRAVDCVSAPTVATTPGVASCVAVGNVSVAGVAAPLVESWDGSRWTVAAVTAPASPSGVYLSAVDCPTTTRCIAVGDIGTDAGHQAIVATLAGTTWTTRVLDPPAGEREGSLEDVSCPTAVTCYAVGSTGALSEGSRYRATAYRLQGTTWSQLHDPVATSERFGLTALSCVDVRTCVAVGSDTRDYPATPVAEVFDGTFWHRMTLPNVSPSTSPGLADVSCPTTSSCVAVGSTRAENGDGQPLVETLTNTTWRTTPVTGDPSLQGALQSVSCSGSTRCTAVGATSPRPGTSSGQAFAATLANGAWTGGPADSRASGFEGVACAGSDVCVAVGDTDGVPLADARTTPGADWVDMAAAAGRGYVGGAFTGVACSATNACTAGGFSYGPGRATAAPLVNRWNGTAWTQQTVPAVGDARIASVTCPASNLCFAVGAITMPNTDRLPLLLQWRRGAWAKVTITLPRRGTASLNAVSCSSTTSCLAVGQSGGYSGTPVAIAFSGTRWALTPTPPVDGVGGARLTGVSCVTGAGCRVIGGGYDTSTFSSRGIDVVWDGSAFTTGPPVVDSDAVSCTGATTCAAVGGFDDQQTVASVFDGTAWSPEALPDPSGSFANVNGVACRGTLACVAVGASYGGAFIARRAAAGSWAAEPVTDSGPGRDTLQAVACPTDSRCVAVGGDGGPTIVVSPSG